MLEVVRFEIHTGVSEMLVIGVINEEGGTLGG